jgi:aryl-alcohol dehydrogenase-like predicted oxidoreductase/enamine deaminase RidA (YjgF/YER057c/UK114 family)
MIPTITLAPGLEISRIITGLWQIADMERHAESLQADATSKAMEAYVKAGLTSFDMADHYGSSEIIAGKFKNENAGAKQLQLFTKWVPKPGKVTREDVRTAVNTALQRMQQSSIDLMQFHAWHYPDPSWLDALFYLNELKEEGLIRHLGVTNFDAAHLRIALASGIPIVSNQVAHSLLDQRAAGNMQAVCEQYGVKLLTYGTLAGGFLSAKWLGKTEPKMEQLNTWSEMKYKRFIDAAGGWDVFQNLLQTIHLLAQKHQVSMANMASSFVFENPQVAAVIIGARLGQSEHIAENIKLLHIQLTADDIQQIRQAQQALKPIPGDCGDEYRKAPFLTASGDLSHHLETIPKAFEVQEKVNGVQQVFSGTVWEELAGFCRAVKDGNRIHISGTTATHGKLMIGGNDPAAQTHFIIDKIEAVLQSFGGSLTDVLRTRIFVNNLNDWEPVARAHGERFKDIQPANTLVEARLVGEGYLVEIEAEAKVG